MGHLEQVPFDGCKHGCLNLIQPQLWSTIWYQSSQKWQVLPIWCKGAGDLVRLAAFTPRQMHLQLLDACPWD